ncbi:S-4TM family putative pore-forming effector [Pseudomonas kuykendallii]|uniref:Uncharacterized protein n=1 Tax=Pseudomonas kuykendallii TaxID=1007099 RepID=A0A1H2Z5U5_9PSED|nr:S-4TM family putative pore-forming effector [Pseudomonas kuykendallii]MCQ4269407.1 S-4TM family putative pore-forming effector [Pseudomonas kuykendallii]SDX12149.1 hypothetical protein SAMN05216287_2159 [Pseudomonas kuykendallii]
MNTINEDQNSSNSIDRIAAFRQAYKNAKFLGRIQIALVFIAFVITLASVVINSPIMPALLNTPQKDISPTIVVVTLFFTLFEIVFLKVKTSEQIELGAKIQELFDTEIFQLSWNSASAGKKPAIEKINNLARKHFKKNPDTQALQNWYSVRPSTPHPLGVLVCQYSCLSWDIELREKIRQSVILISFALTATIALTAVLLNPDTQSTLLNIVSIFMPVFTYAHTIYELNNKTIKHTQEIKDLLSDTMDGITPDTDDNWIMQMCREIQNSIYTYRASAWPIPEWFYWILRDELEDTMSYSATDIQNKLAEKTVR